MCRRVVGHGGWGLRVVGGRLWGGSRRRVGAAGVAGVGAVAGPHAGVVGSLQVVLGQSSQSPARQTQVQLRRSFIQA